MAYLIGKMFHWFGGRVSARTRHMPVYLDDRTLRDIGLRELNIASYTCRRREARTMRTAQIKRTPDRTP